MDGPGLITFSHLGRFGRWANSVIEYAFLRVYARRHGLQYQCPPWAGTPIFGFDDPPVTRRLPERRERYMNGDYQKEPLPPYEGEFRNWDFVGWAQFHTAYYAPDKEFIQGLYTAPVGRQAERVADATQRLRAAGDCRIGIHLRRGDYGLGPFLITPVSWYLRWLWDHWDRFSNPILFIASEAPELVSQFASFRPLTMESLGIAWDRSVPEFYTPLERDVATANPRGLDFFPDWWLLKQCDVMLTPNSTYSFSAAWLNPGLLECWRSRLSTGRFERIDPWNCEMQWKESVDEFPNVPGTHMNKNPYWTHDIRPLYPVVAEGEARRICDIPNFMGNTTAYKLSRPVAHHPEKAPVDIVLVSEVWHHRPATIILPADADYGIASWVELPGTIYGRHDTRGALAVLGFVLKD